LYTRDLTFIINPRDKNIVPDYFYIVCLIA